MKTLFKGFVPFLVMTLVLGTPVSYGQAVFGPAPSNNTNSDFVIGPSSVPTSENKGPLYVGPIRITEEQYVEKLFHLVSIPYIGIEMIQNSCKPAGGGLTDSLADFAGASKGFITAELERDALIKQRTALLQKVSDDLASKKDSELHIEAVRLQLETMNINLDAVTGSSLFTRDKSQKLATETAGIPQLEKLAVKTLKAIAQNTKDHQDMVDTWNGLVDGIIVSGQIAAEACKRKKKVEECTVCEGGGCAENEEVRTCKIVEKDDPVPGSCEMAGLLPPYQNGPVLEYAELYKKPSMPSTELNNGMKKLEETMKKTVESFPKSNDPEYDWTTPLLKHEKMAETRKKYGLLCPPYDPKGDSKEKSDQDKTAANFVLPLGVGGELGKKAGKIMNANFAVVDNVIGQPGNRAEAFSLALKLINEMIQIENSRVQMKLAEYDRLKAALAKLIPTMSGGKGLEECNKFVIGGSAPNPNCPSGGSSSGGGTGGQGKVTTTTTSGSSSGAAAANASGRTSQGGSKDITGAALEELPGENEIIRRNRAQINLSNSSASTEVAPNRVSYGTAESGEFVVGPLSSSNMAVAKGLASEIKNTTIALQKKASAAGQPKASGMVSSTNSNFGGVNKFGNAFSESAREIGTVADYKEIAKALNSNTSSISAAESIAEAERIMRSSSRDLGYSSGGKGTYNSGGSYSNSSSSSTGTSGSKDIAASNPAQSSDTADSSEVPQKWQKRAAPIELFDNISNAYKKHGRSKLGLDEIRGEND